MEDEFTTSRTVFERSMIRVRKKTKLRGKLIKGNCFLGLMNVKTKVRPKRFRGLPIYIIKKLI